MEKPTFAAVYDFQNLLDAAENAYSSISTKKRLRAHVREFMDRLEENLIELQNELIWREYRMNNFFVFKVYEPKERNIAALPFRDRVVQIALCNIIEPYIEKRFIYDSYSCRKEKGMLLAARRAAYFMGRPDGAKYEKCDIHKYFDSIDLDVLMEIIRRYIDDEGILWLIELIIRKDNPKKGIKIGNRFSQLAANIYLHELDFYVKEYLHIKYYVRFADDFLIFGQNKGQLQAYFGQIQAFLADVLHLETNDKTRIGNCRDGVDFVGYQIYPNHIVIKKKSMRRTKNVLHGWMHGKMSDADFAASIGSRCGHAKGTVSYIFYNKILLRALFHEMKKYRKLEEAIQNRTAVQAGGIQG
jgi:retron-type reverse transcriptase